MHKVSIPENVLRSVEARRGKLHVYDTLVGRETALLVIDLQNAFMLPGMPAEIAHARDIVSNVNRLAASLRAAGGKVVWIQMTCTDTDLAEWKTYFDGLSVERGRAMLTHLTPGTPGHALYSELDVRRDDMRAEKRRYSAFIQGSSDLDANLRASGITTVLIAGTLTNTCCEASARDAMMLNYRTVIVSDANATRTDEEHNASLISFIQGFGDVYDTEEIVGILSNPA